ncbi:MAG: STN domain-containing protein [Cephaloticoccus sp.]|nr:STN domain-containing protein [Cephaloticoccus sp.]
MAVDDTKIKFDLPADIVARSVKTFALQSGKEILISAELGRDIRTKPVKGEFTPSEAVNRMLNHTGLMATEDEKTGAIVILLSTEISEQGESISPDIHSAKKKST